MELQFMYGDVNILIKYVVNQKTYVEELDLELIFKKDYIS